MNPKHKKKIDELIDSIALSMKIEADRLYRSGGIDVGSFDDNEYRLAKILVTTAMIGASKSLIPNNHSDWDHVSNLIHF